MRRLFALIFVFGMWLTFIPPANAQQASLIRCSDSPAFIQRAKAARDTTADPQSGEKRFQRYAQAMCGPEGLPHLIVDGNLSRAGDFLIPSIMFLYIAGQIGWAGRSYLIATKKKYASETEIKEVILDVPLAFQSMVSAFAWPLAAVKELLSGELTAKDEEIPISPR